ncbi:hypothetical protein I302_105233 [Kwoniella bestiolae CBS 10118]|uniref:Xylanolytic transcriptional activator regulatory domain-containing protein n=1 Tax=Kwoniella bestiolae CBS 10118 TaxID=1296100 RepID=A0AAJ8K9F3_9TREE
MPPHYPQEPNHPTDLSMPPPPDKIIHIDTGPIPSSSHTHHSDVAGVLRRNQACLQCRKRKLARPHCATCVRSYRHLLRTSPKSNPVLCCDYDEGTGGSHHEEAEKAEKGSASKSPAQEKNQGPEDDDGGGKKKRKAGGEGRRKKKDEEFEEERDRLTKKIEELQAQLTQNLSSAPQKQNQPAPARAASTMNPSLQETLSATSAPSPTAFLEMLSSAASSQVPNSASGSNAAKSSDQTGGTPYWLGQMDSGSTADAGSGFRPMFMFDHSNQQSDASAIRVEPSPDAQSQESRRSSLLTPGAGDSSSQSQNILSPGGVFNFSPGPSTNFMSSWPPGPDPITGNIEPSTKVDGPWRAVETVETVYAASMMNTQNPVQDQQNFNLDTNMETEINLDGLQAGLDAAMQQQLLMDLFWPGWPINLPEPNVVNDLIEAFFDLVPNLPRVLHRARFLSRMALPPTHSNFPHPALIHAVCAAAAAWCSPEIYEKSTRGKGRDFFDTTGAGMYGNDVLGSQGKGSKANLTFGLRQASFAKEAVQEGLNTGNRLFDVVRAMIILCRVFIDDTRMLECWAYGGLVSRMLLPLGLNVRSAELSLKSVMLPPPADALEREERRAAVWMAFYHDTIASSASGWGTSMSLDELTVPLPVSFKDFEMGHETMEPNPQDLESPDFWVKHPVPDSFVMVVKASVLMNRVNKFARRWKNRHMKDNDDFDGLYKPEFREIANSIACLQMSFPATLRNVGKLTAKRKLDIDLIAAQMLPHAAIICLHEPFADLYDPSDQAARRMLGATQAIVSIVQQLASVFGENGLNFTSVMHSSASVCLVTSARTSLLFLRHALNVGDMAAAQSHRTDCEMIRMALSQFGLKFKIGHHHSQLIEYFLDRATNPTYEKLQAHYPDHPRSGAPELTPTANFGLCVANALNIKRGFWRLSKQSTSTGASPFGSTPESMGSGSHASRPHASSSSSVSRHLSDHDSPNHPLENLGLRGGQNQPPLNRNASSTDAMDTDQATTDQFKDWVPCAPLRAGSKSDSAEGGAKSTEKPFDISLPGVTPVTQAYKERFTTKDTVRPDGQYQLWWSTSENELLAESQARKPSQASPSGKDDTRNEGNMDTEPSGAQQTTLSEYGLCDMAPPSTSKAPSNKFDISLPGVTPVTKEMMAKIQARGVMSADGQYPVWINTSEKDLLAEAQAQAQARQLQEQEQMGGSESRLTKEMEEIYSQFGKPGAGSGTGGFMPYISDDLARQLGSQLQDNNESGRGMSKEMETRFSAFLQSGSGTGTGTIPQTQGITSTSTLLNPEIEDKFSKIKTVGSDGHLQVIQNLTQEQIMAEINRNGGLPADGQMGWREGEKEYGRVGEMLRRVYE